MAYGSLNVDSVVSSDGTTSGGLYGFKNRIINGAMVISQRGTSFATPADNSYTLDRWFTNTSGGGVYSVAQSSDAPTGFTNSTLITVTTADASIASSDYYIFTQRIEGYNVADLAYGSASASPITVSFWVKSSVTGAYGVSVLGYNASYRTYVSTVTINSANTWEYKSFTVSGDTASVIRTNSNWGLGLAFDLGCGSGFNTSAGSWTSGEKYGTSGSTKLISTNGATLQISGIQLEKGNTATSFDYRPYGTELSLCQRYYYGWTQGYANEPVAVGQNYNTTDCYAIIYLKVPMRTQPNSTVTAGSTFNKLGGAAWSGASIAATAPQTIELLMTSTGLVSGGASNVLGLGSVTPFVITASAEL